jgi:hypothetical protein
MAAVSSVSTMTLKRFYLLLAREGRSYNYHALHCPSYLPLKLLSKTVSGNLLLMISSLGGL